MASWYHITNEKNYAKTVAWKRGSRPFFVYKELSTKSIGKWEIFEAGYLDMYQQKYLNLLISADWPPQIPFDRRFIEN